MLGSVAVIPCRYRSAFPRYRGRAGRGFWWDFLGFYGLQLVYISSQSDLPEFQDGYSSVCTWLYSEHPSGLIKTGYIRKKLISPNYQVVDQMGIPLIFLQEIVHFQIIL
ncbi:hypothetical protein CEE45_12610 [Candidatus Heimdallarchaeota archaeon B3_Heim]|nr:MAG: hypothetical protein CEE45_12610 [Candidatus Heimdallarchaeota archaeon B3_Heim]